MSSKIFLSFQASDNNSTGTATSSNTIVNWESYDINTSFLTPCDSFSLKVGSDKISNAVRALLDGGGTILDIYVSIDDGSPNRPILRGKIDESVLEGDATGGTYYHIHGRNLLGDTMEGGLDPWSSKNQITDGTTVAGFMANIFIQFGFKVIYNTDIANRGVKTGNLPGNTTYTTSTIPISVVQETGTTGSLTQVVSSSQTVTLQQDLSNDFNMEALTIKELKKPEHSQSAYEFAEIIAKRFRAHIWMSADGLSVIVGQPDYTQQPLYIFNNTASNPSINNVIKFNRSLQYKDQPAMIMGRGVTDAGDFGSATIRAAKVSEFYGFLPGTETVTPFVENDLSSFNNFNPMPVTEELFPYQKYFTPPNNSRTMYLFDKHAKTQGELESVLRRKMSEHMRNAFKITYTVEDHDQNGVVYAINTMATVNDEILNIQGVFWIESIIFKQDIQGGTTSQITLIPPFVLDF